MIVSDLVSTAFIYDQVSFCCYSGNQHGHCHKTLRKRTPLVLALHITISLSPRNFIPFLFLLLFAFGGLMVWDIRANNVYKHGYESTGTSIHKDNSDTFSYRLRSSFACTRTPTAPRTQSNTPLPCANHTFPIWPPHPAPSSGPSSSHS